MKKYPFHLLTGIFLAGLVYCKKEASLPEENTPVQPVIQNTAPEVYIGLDMKIILAGSYYY